MVLPTTADAVYDKFTGDLLRWGTGVDFGAADDFDADTETYRTDLPYPGKISTNKDGFFMDNWNGSTWIEKLLIDKSDSIYTADEFTDLTNWDTASGGDFDLFDDLPDADVFSPKCLRLPSNKIGRIALKTAQLNVTDMWVEVHGYNRVDDADSMSWFIGLRVDYATDDGYYIGFESGDTESKMQIIYRAGGLNSVIKTGDGLRGLGFDPDQELIFRAAIKDDRIQQQIIKLSDGSILAEMFTHDSNISASGSAGIAVFTSSNINQRLDKFQVFNMAL